MGETIYRKKKRKRYDTVDIVCFVVLTLFAIAIILPFWNAVVISLETYSAYVKNPIAFWPGEFSLDNYKFLMGQTSGLIQAYKNTIAVTLAGTALAMVITTLTGYAFTMRFPGKKFFFYMMLVTMFFGGGLIPLYLQIKRMGLMDTLTCIVLLGLGTPYYIIVMKNGFESIPRELSEAAMLDGANELYIFSKVMLPLQKPMIATFSLFNAVNFWNGWYWPMLVLNNPKKSLLQLFLRSLINSASQKNDQQLIMSMAEEEMMTYSLGIQMAAVFAVVLPIMLVYPFLQKYFVKGMLVGGIKM